MIRNIQSLFSTISVDQVKDYLTWKGWQLQTSPGRIDFEKIDEHADDFNRLFLPAERTHAKYRSLLANLIFSLAVIEQREAVDIANEISSAQPPSVDRFSDRPAHSGQSPAVAVQLILRNQSPTTASVKVVGSNASSGGLLRSGDQVHVRLCEQSLPDVLEFAGDIVLETCGNSLPEVLLALPAETSAANGELTEWLNGSVASVANADSAGPRIPLRELEAMAARFHFAMEGIEDLQTQPAPLIRACAIFLCQLIQRLHATEAAKSVAFELARRLVSRGGLTFTLDLKHPEALWQAALSDDCSAPRQTSHWLSANSKPLKTEQQSKQSAAKD